MSDEPDATAETSLIKQRKKLDSRRFRSIFTVVLGAVGIAAQIVALFGGLDDAFWLTLTWVLLGFLIVVVGVGVRQLWKVRSARAAFESKHGVDAGRQQAIK